MILLECETPFIAHFDKFNQSEDICGVCRTLLYPVPTKISAQIISTIKQGDNISCHYEYFQVN